MSRTRLKMVGCQAVTERTYRLDGLADLPSTGWQALTRGRPGLRLEVLRSLAQSSNGQQHFEVFLTEDSAGLVAAAICMRFEGRRGVNRVDQCLFGRGAALARAVGITTAPVMVISQPLGSGCGALLRSGVPITDGRRIYAQLVDQIEARADALGCGVAFDSVMPGDEPALCAVLNDRGYLSTEDLPTTRLAVEWQDFEGYVKHVRKRSRGSAGMIRRESNHNQRSGVVIRLLPADVAHARDLDALQRSHFRRKNGVEPSFGPEFLPQLSAMLPDDFLIIEARRGDQVLGLVGLVRSGDTAWAAWIGMVDADQRRDFTYFNIFYYVAAHATELGIRTVWFGNAAYEAKLLRGCELVAMPLFYRPRSALARLLARPYLRFHRSWYRRKQQ